MFDRLFRTKAAEADEPRPSLQEKYESWRFQRDVAAIMATLDRLSDRRLAMIGLHRDTLFETVSDMMVEAERQRQVGHEVLAMLENATDEHAGEAIQPPAETPKIVSAAA